MTKYRIVDYVRDPADGSGQASATVTLKLHNGGSTVTSDSSDANGRAEMTHDTVGYPGPVYLTGTVGSTTRVKSGNVWGQLGGLVWADDIPDVFTTNGIGVVPGAGSELAATGSGSNMNITIASGMAILKDGLPYVLDASTTVAISNGDASHARYDRIVLRLTREEQTDQGKIVLYVIEGTPAASPAVPSLTQSSATWDFPLCTVSVAQSAVTLSTGNLTDTRTFCWTYPLTTRGDMLVVNSSGKPARLAVGSSGQFLTSDGTDPSWGAISAGSLPSSIDATKIADGSISNTEFQYLNNVSSNIQTQLSGKAASSHTHAATDIGAGDVSNTELSYLDGATGNIQSQLNTIAQDTDNMKSNSSNVYLAMDDTVHSTSSTSVYTDVCTLNVSVPTVAYADNYIVEAIGQMRATHSSSGQVKLRLTINGVAQTGYDKNATSSSGASFLQCFGDETIAGGYGVVAVVLQMRSQDAGTSTCSNATIICTVRPVAG